MRYLMIALCVLACAASADVLTPSQRSFLKNRRVCVSRDTTTIPGHVITTWHRNSGAAEVFTNELRLVVGAQQSNPLQASLATWRDRYADLTNRFHELSLSYTAATSRVSVVEGKAARLDSLKEWLEAQRDKAVLQTTKALYQAILDRMEAE